MFRSILIWNGVYGFREKMGEIYGNCIIKDLFHKIKAVKLASRNDILLL